MSNILNDIVNWAGDKVDQLGSKLEDMGTAGTAIQIVDPTGITGYKDVKDSYQNFKEDSSLANAGLLGLAALGALPMIGVFGKAKKFQKIEEAIGDVTGGIKKLEKASDAEKITQKATTVKEAEKTISKMYEPVSVSKEFSKYLNSIAKKTNDERIQRLAEAVGNNQKLPHAYVKYLQSIFKDSSLLHTDTKNIKIGSQIKADPEIVKFKGKEIERPTFEKTVAVTKKVQDEALYGKDDISFKRILVKDIPEKLPMLDAKLESAIKYLDSINKGTFKIDRQLLSEIYSKSKSTQFGLKDTKEHTDLLRFFFGRLEVPKIIERQVGEGYVHPVSLDSNLDQFYEASKNNISWWKDVLKRVQEWRDENGLVGEISVRPRIARPRRKEIPVYARDANGEIIFPGRYPSESELTEALEKSTRRIEPISKPGDYDHVYKPIVLTHTMRKQTKPFVTGYDIYVGNRRAPVTPKFPFEQHHALPLGLIQSKLYLQNPNPSRYEHIFDYQRMKKDMMEKEGKNFYDQFLALLKEEHTGKSGIHNFSDIKLNDLPRIKELSRSGYFESLDDLLAFYREIKNGQTELLQRLIASKGIGGRIYLINWLKRGGYFSQKPKNWQEYQKQNRKK